MDRLEYNDGANSFDTCYCYFIKALSSLYGLNSNHSMLDSSFFPDCGALLEAMMDAEYNYNESYI